MYIFNQMGLIKCPVLLIVGEDDQNWPASESAKDVSIVIIVFNFYHGFNLVWNTALLINMHTKQYKGLVETVEL